MSTKVSTSTPPLTPSQIAAQEAQTGLLTEQTNILKQQQSMENMLLPYVFQSSGLTPQYDANGNITSIKQSPEAAQNAQQQQQIQLASGQYYLNALQGNLPVNPQLQQERQQSDQTFQQWLVNQYGQGGQGSSGALLAQRNQTQTWEAAFEAARRGDLTLANQLNLTGSAGIGAGQQVIQSPVGTIGSLLPGVQGGIQSANNVFSTGLGLQQLGLQHGIARNNALNAFWGDIAGGIGGVGGAVAGMYA